MHLRPVVLAYHILWCAYGFWLPNDERGSNSRFLGSIKFLPFGRAT